jgi:hypothetical protein
MLSTTRPPHARLRGIEHEGHGTNKTAIGRGVPTFTKSLENTGIPAFFGRIF